MRARPQVPWVSIIILSRCYSIKEQLCVIQPDDTPGISLRPLKRDSYLFYFGIKTKGASAMETPSVLNVDFSLFRPLEFFVDSKNGDGRNNNPPAMRVRVDCYTKKLPFRVQ